MYCRQGVYTTATLCVVESFFGAHLWLTSWVSHITDKDKDIDSSLTLLTLQKHTCQILSGQGYVMYDMASSHGSLLSVFIIVPLKKYGNLLRWICSVAKILLPPPKFMNVKILAEYKLHVGNAVTPMPSSAKKTGNLFHKKQNRGKHFFSLFICCIQLGIEHSQLSYSS